MELFVSFFFNIWCTHIKSKVHLQISSPGPQLPILKPLFSIMEITMEIIVKLMWYVTKIMMI